MGRAILFVLLGAAVAGCTARTDFTYPTFHNPFVDKSEIGKPYITEGVKSPSERRAERMAQVMAAWQSRPTKAVPSEFRIGVDDVLEINYIFFGAADASDRVITLKRTVPADGRLSLPWVGNMPVKGLTVAEMEDAIRTAGERYVKAPHVGVNVLEYHSTGVLVSGAVARPGVYYLFGDRNTVLDLLAQANGLTWGSQAGSFSGGGITAGELPDELIIFRKRKTGAAGGGQEGKPGGIEPGPAPGPGGTKPPVPGKPSGGGGAEAKPPAGAAGKLPAGTADKPTAGQPGQVGQLVQEYLKRTEPAPKEAVSQVAKKSSAAPDPPAGGSAGMPGDASSVNPLYADRERIAVDLRQLFDEGNMLYNIELQNDDIVHVPPVVNKYIYVMGYVNSPGQKVITDRMQVDAVTAIGMAGGLTNSARAEKTFLIRQTDQGAKRVQVDLIKMYQGIRPPIYLQTGDCIVVGTNWAVRLMNAMTPSASQGWDKDLKFVGGGTGFSFIGGQ